MKHILSPLLIVVLAAILAACAPGAGFSLPIAIPGMVSPTPTECGCTVKGTVIATPTGGLSAAGPAGPSAKKTTPAPGSQQSQWTAYTNAQYGFSFEVPTAYNEGKYQFCAARDAQPPAGSPAKAVINLGSRTVITLLPASGQTAQTAVDAFKADPAHKDYQFDPASQTTVGGEAALTLPYHSGGTNRYRESTFFVHGDTVYRVDVGSPSACDIEALSLREIDAYRHLLETWKFKA